MSSYLNIALKTKKSEDNSIKEEQLVHLWSFSRNSDIYQFFYENNLSSYSSEAKYTKIKREELISALGELKDEIAKDQKRMSLMKELKQDSVEDVLSWQEYIDDKITLENNVQMILSLISEYSYNDVEGLYSYID